MMDELIEKIVSLRKQLHNCPETAFHEYKTRETVMTFLRKETEFEVRDMGSWFYAVIPGNTEENPIAFRADHDAVCGKNGLPGHYCGHDGHTASLTGAALYFAKHKPERTVYLIFQPAEETGEGANVCAPLLKEKGISEIYAYHNIPGYPMGSILVRKGTFACASTGLEISMKGTPSHAAYPEFGVNPAKEIAQLIFTMQEQLAKPHRGMVLGTVIGAEIGGAAYGVSADSGVLRLTLRGEFEDEFSALVNGMEKAAYEAGQQCGAEVSVRRIEPFFATENSDICTERIRNAAAAEELKAEDLKEPFRWSEDFGGYLRYAEGAMFGIGDGEESPQLHTAEFEFPDAILENAIRMFVRIANMK